MVYFWDGQSSMISQMEAAIGIKETPRHNILEPKRRTSSPGLGRGGDHQVDKRNCLQQIFPAGLLLNGAANYGPDGHQ